VLGTTLSEMFAEVEWESGNSDHEAP